jgi:hypothetical protein
MHTYVSSHTCILLECYIMWVVYINWVNLVQCGSTVNYELCYILASLSVTEPCHNVFFDGNCYTVTSSPRFTSLQAHSRRRPRMLLY